MPFRGRMGATRETRLLAATIAVSLVVLLVLSRFRFPAASDTPSNTSSAQPLARLAARAAFDDLSLAVRELTSRVSGSLVVIRTSEPTGEGDRGRRPGAAGPRLVPALRVRDDAALVAVSEGTRVEGVLGMPGPTSIIARDPVRGLALVRVPPLPAPTLSVREDTQPPSAPGYAAVAEAGIGGAALRPVFVGRSDGVTDPRWDVTLFTLGRSVSSDTGAPVFLLDGRLAGLVTLTDQEPTLVPASALMAAVDQLLRGSVPTNGDIGIAVQGLDQALARATGTSSGAVVAAVQADGPADGQLGPGDVVVAVNGQPIRSPDALRLRVSRAPIGTLLSLTIRRAGGSTTVPVTVRARPTAGPPAGGDAAAATVAPALGLTMRAVPNVGSEVLRVQAGSAAETAGLRPGDLVVSLGRARTPSPADISTAFAELAGGATLFLSVERDGEPRLVVLGR